MFADAALDLIPRGCVLSLKYLTTKVKKYFVNKYIIINTSLKKLILVC